jgi:hypothetical protein
MRQLITSIFLAVLLIDLAGSVHPAPCHNGQEPPKGVRRMLETLANNRRGPQQWSNRNAMVGDPVRQDWS